MVSQRQPRGRGKKGENVGKRLYCVFHVKEEVRQSEQTQDWLVGIILAGFGAQRLCRDIR